MRLTEHLGADRVAHVVGRLNSDLIAWFTTVRPDGQPVSVPVWFLLRDDETILLDRQPNKSKLRNLELNPRVTLVLDDTHSGRDVIRIDETAHLEVNVPPVDQNDSYLAKYSKLIGPVFGTPEHLASLYTNPILITLTRLRDYRSLN